MDNIIKNKQEYTEDCEFPLVFAEDYSVKTKVLRR
jgi:hypothetical protein